MFIINKYINYIIIMITILLYAGTVAASEPTKSCIECHTNILRYEIKHNVPDNACSNCHIDNKNKHPESKGNEFTFAGKYPKKKYATASVESFALCFKCHKSNIIAEEHTTSATNFRNGDLNLHFLHVNGKKGRACGLCHSTHSSKNKYRISETILFGKWDMPINFKATETGGSCYPGCHKEQQYKRSQITDKR